jgi:uncharacterized cupin superfamily protein
MDFPGATAHGTAFRAACHLFRQAGMVHTETNQNIEGVAMTKSKVIHFDPGQAMAPWPEIPASALIEGKPVQQGHLYFQDPAYGLKVGVWHCTPMHTKEGPHGSNEYCIILDGSASVIDADGKEHHFGPGEAMFLPKGVKRQWKQTEHCHKFFFIFEDPSGSQVDDPEALRPMRMEGHGPGGKMAVMDLPDISRFVDGVPTQHIHTYHADPSGQLTAGVWDCTPMTTKGGPFPRHELMSILEGSVTIREEGVGDHVFKAGDTFLVEKGAPISWKSEEYVRKYFMIFYPDEAMARVADAAE